MKDEDLLGMAQIALRKVRHKKFIDRPFHEDAMEHSIQLRNMAYDNEEGMRKLGLKTMIEAIDVPMANAVYYYTAGEYAKTKRALAEAAAVCLRGIEFLDKEEKKQ